MLRLVTIDLRNADLALFEAYEAKVLSRLGLYGGRLEIRVRSLDEALETHLLSFPDAVAYEAYRADPERVAAQNQWETCGARSSSAVVERI